MFLFRQVFTDLLIFVNIILPHVLMYVSHFYRSIYFVTYVQVSSLELKIQSHSSVWSQISDVENLLRYSRPISRLNSNAKCSTPFVFVKCRKQSNYSTSDFRITFRTRLVFVNNHSVDHAMSPDALWRFLFHKHL